MSFMADTPLGLEGLGSLVIGVTCVQRFIIMGGTASILFIAKGCSGGLAGPDPY